MPVMTTRSRIKPARYHRNFRRSTTLLASTCLHVLVAASVVASQPPASKELFNRIYQRTAARRESIHSIRARFTETTVSSLLERPMVAHGTMTAAPPGLVLMTYADPERRTIVVDGKSLVIVWSDRHERETVDISQIQKRIDQYFTQANPEQLQAMFDIRVQADAAMRGADRIDMLPRRKQIKDGLERLELWIDRERLLLTQLQMTFPGGDTKTITLEDIAVNVPIGDDTFQIRP
jgi:outer membrane lipoprotein-sorting protein